MRHFAAKHWALIIAVTAASLTLACGESPIAPEAGLNPALLGGDNAFGFATTNTLPQGAADFVGPGGMPMDATAMEVIQQLTFRDGTVFRTSGFHVHAVPDESITNATFDNIIFGVAHTGSLQSAPLGSYLIALVPPTVNMVDDVDPFGFARVQITRGATPRWADAGVFSVQEVHYLDDVFPCAPTPLDGFTIDLCEYQIGLVSGFVEFRLELADGAGQIVQERQPFTLPIRRETIIIRQTRGS